MVNTITDIDSFPDRSPSEERSVATVPVGRDRQGACKRPRLRSPWACPTFYVAIPLTLVLLTVLFAIRLVTRFRHVARTSTVR